MIEGPASPASLVVLGALALAGSVTMIYAVAFILNNLVNKQLHRQQPDRQQPDGHLDLIERGFFVSVIVYLDLATFRNGLDDYIRRTWAYKPPDLAMPRWFPGKDSHTVEIFDVPPGFPTDKTKAVIRLFVLKAIDNKIGLGVTCLSPSAASFAFEFVLSLPLVLQPADEWMAAKETRAPETIDIFRAKLEEFRKLVASEALVKAEELKPGPAGLGNWRIVPANSEIVKRRKRVAELKGLDWRYEDIARELAVSTETVKNDLQAMGLTKSRNRKG